MNCRAARQRSCCQAKQLELRFVVHALLSRCACASILSMQPTCSISDAHPFYRLPHCMSFDRESIEWPHHNCNKLRGCLCIGASRPWPAHGSTSKICLSRIASTLRTCDEAWLSQNFFLLRCLGSSTQQVRFKLNCKEGRCGLSKFIGRINFNAIPSPKTSAQLRLFVSSAQRSSRACRGPVPKQIQATVPKYQNPTIVRAFISSSWELVNPV